MSRKEESTTDIREILQLLSQEHVTLMIWFSSWLKREQARITIVRQPKVPLRIVMKLTKAGFVTTTDRDYLYHYVLTDAGRGELARLKEAKNIAAVEAIEWRTNPEFPGWVYAEDQALFEVGQFHAQRVVDEHNRCLLLEEQLRKRDTRVHELAEALEDIWEHAQEQSWSHIDYAERADSVLLQRPQRPAKSVQEATE